MTFRRPSLASPTQRALWVFGPLILLLGFFGAPAYAQDDVSSLFDRTAHVVAVDASADPAEAMVFSSMGDVSGAQITADGASEENATAVGSLSADRPTELVYVVDVNRRSARGGAFDEIKESLGEAVEALPAGVDVAIVAAGDSAIVLSELTRDRNETLQAIDELSFRTGSDLYSSIGRVDGLFSSETAAVRSIVAIATGPDTQQRESLAAVKSAVIREGAQLVVLQYEGGDPELNSLATASGGLAADVTSVNSLKTGISTASAIAAERLVIPFDTADADAGTRSNATLVVGDATQDFSFINGQYSRRVSQISGPVNLNPSSSLFTGPLFLGLLILLAFVGLALAVWSVSSMFIGRARLDTILERYDAADPALSESEAREAVVENLFVKRAVQLSENFAEKRGFLAASEGLLQRANLPIRPGEALVFLVVGMLAAFGAGLLLTGSFVAALVLVVVVAILAYFVLQFLAARRRKKFEAQLPDTLQLLAGTLRAGYSLPQGIDAVSKEIAAPMGPELRRAMNEAQLGREIEDSLAAVGERLDSPDFAWAVMAIGIQREVGGNLNELLMTVAETMIERERLRREINSLTAEGRMSAIILGLLPPGLGLVLGLGNPEYIGVLFTDLRGNILLGVAVFSSLIGLAWMKKVITLNV